MAEKDLTLNLTFEGCVRVENFEEKKRRRKTLILIFHVLNRPCEKFLQLSIIFLVKNIENIYVNYVKKSSGKICHVYVRSLCGNKLRKMAPT